MVRAGRWLGRKPSLAQEPLGCKDGIGSRLDGEFGEQCTNVSRMMFGDRSEVVWDAGAVNECKPAPVRQELDVAPDLSHAVDDLLSGHCEGLSRSLSLQSKSSL